MVQFLSRLLLSFQIETFHSRLNKEHAEIESSHLLTQASA